MKKIIKYFLIILMVISIALLNIPTPSINKANYIEFYDCDGNLIDTQIKNKSSEYIYLDELNDYTINAFIAFEDKHFYKHNGFDFFRIIKSFFTNIFNGDHLIGASTITQQYARILFLNNKKSLIRKIKEAYYTIKLELKYSKDKILEGYLNNIYLGHNCYGIESASNYYFSKSSKDLSLEESALLASLASSPSSGSPYNNFDKSMTRKNLVLDAMLKENYITQSEHNIAKNKNIILNNQSQTLTNINYYLDKVKKDITDLNIPYNKGLKVYTNIDTNLHNKIDNIINKYDNNTDELSIIVLQNNSNKVLVSIGGYNYNTTSYNRSLYSSRQVGSTIKTFLYAFALENGISTDTLLKSEPTSFNIKGYGLYSPANSNNKYANAYINMKEAYAVSDNIYATKILLLLGSDNFNNYLSRFNLSSKDNVPSIALGTLESTLYKLTTAYSVFSSQGSLYKYSFIDEIYDSYNNLIYSSNKFHQQVINKSITKEIVSLMELPFKKNNYYTSSTMQNYNMIGYYGKTGSTNNDSYVIFSNDEYTIGIRVGNDDYNNKFYNYSTSKLIARDISLIT